jgi:hypothetical protein
MTTWVDSMSFPFALTAGTLHAQKQARMLAHRPLSICRRSKEESQLPNAPRRDAARWDNSGSSVAADLPLRPAELQNGPANAGKSNARRLGANLCRQAVNAQTNAR